MKSTRLGDFFVRLGAVAMDEHRVREAITVLDREVPREGARVKFSQYGGGPDEGQIIANQAGYLRLGVEFLKGAFHPTDDTDGSAAAHIDLEYLVTDDSTINFDWFEIREMMESSDTTSSKVSGVLIGIALLVVTVGILVFAIIGMVAVFS